MWVWSLLKRLHALSRIGKLFCRCPSIRLLVRIPRVLLGIPPMSFSSPCPLVCGSVLRLSARPLVPGLVPVTRGLPPLVRPALIGLVVHVNHLALLGPVRRPSRSRTTTVSFSLFFIFSMVYFSFFFLLMALTVISVNVNGLRDEHRRLGFLQWLSHLSASIVCLQETHAVSFADL